jgi:hypothetical protein
MRLLIYLTYLWSKLVLVKKETVAQKAYRLLKDIPPDKWGMYRLHGEEGKSCFLGHYQKLTGIPEKQAYESDIFREKTKFLLNIHNIPSGSSC